MIHTVPAVTLRRRTARGQSRLGDTAQTVVGGTAQAAGTAIAAVQAASSAGLITLTGSLAAAVPVAGAIVAVGVLAFSLLHNSRGLQQNVETTHAVNNAAEIMQKNLDAWNASPKSYATQVQALQTFDDTWQAVVNFCSNGNEGDPGRRCVSERQRGGKYDFASYYRDPIANDPAAGLVDKAAAEAVNPLSSVGFDLSSGSSGKIPAVLLIGGLVVLTAATWKQ